MQSGGDAGSDVAVDGCAKRLSALQPRSVFSPRHTCRSDVCPRRHEGGRFRGEPVGTIKTQRGLRESGRGRQAVQDAGGRPPGPQLPPDPCAPGSRRDRRGRGGRKGGCRGEARGPLTCGRRTQDPLRHLSTRQHRTFSPARVRALMRAKSAPA